MLNYIWAGMILVGILYAAFTGNMESVTKAALESGGEAISLCITMAGVMALWMGLMEIGRQAGLIAKCTSSISPFLDFLFPKIPKKHPAREYIATNIIANILGLGWACTPAGLKAMDELKKLEEERRAQTEKAKETRFKITGEQAEETRFHISGEQAGKKTMGNTVTNKAGVASDEMCNFLILNISSLQLIPVNMIAYRSQYGSAKPAEIIAPAILATCFSTLIAIVYIKLRNRYIK